MTTVDIKSRMGIVNQILSYKKDALVILNKVKDKGIMTINEIRRMEGLTDIVRQSKTIIYNLLTAMVNAGWLKRERLKRGFSYEIDFEGDNVLRNGVNFKYTV